MAKYFKVVEIDEEEFNKNAGGVLDCSQIVSPVTDIMGYLEAVFVAVDEEQENEIQIPLDCFE